MATKKIPATALTSLTISVHHHPLPLCKNGYHDRTCRRHKREIDCRLVRIPDNQRRLIQFAVCTHFQ